MLFLSDAKRTQLIAKNRRERDKRIGDQIKAVLLFDKGQTPLAGAMPAASLV